MEYAVRAEKYVDSRAVRPEMIRLFFKLLSQQPYSDKELHIQLAYYQWLPEDPYQLCTIKPLGENNEMSLHILSQMISRHLQNSVVLKKKPP